MTMNINRSETDLLVFISSVMSPELEIARKLSREAFKELGFTRPWAFEFTPASSESPEESYLRKVQESDFVVWLIGNITTQPVANEIHTCMASGSRLIAVLLPGNTRDDNTMKLMGEVGDYAKWGHVDDIADLKNHLKHAISDQLVRALRNPANPTRVLGVQHSLDLSLSRCKHSWRALGVSEETAITLTQDETIGAVAETISTGLHVILGDQGAGKTLAAERFIQQTARLALKDFSLPLPLFIRARDLTESLANYITRWSHGLWQPVVHGAIFVIDGLDELGITRANSLMEEIRVYVDANPNVTAIVTTRKLPDLHLPDDNMDVPQLDDQAIVDIMAKVAGHHVDTNTKFGWPTSIREAVKRPLFAIILGVELSKDRNFAPVRPSELIDRVVRNALGDSVGAEQRTEELLQRLAVRSMDIGRRVKLSEFGETLNDQNILSQSRLVTLEGSSLDFALPIFREWYAARAIIEKSIVIDEIIASNDASERWLIPITIAVESVAEDSAFQIMSTIVGADPGFAGLLLEEPAQRWQHSSSARPGLNSPIDYGEQIRNSMAKWDDGLGDLFSIVGPSNESGGLPTLGVRLQNAYITTSWYRGTETLPPVIELPEAIRISGSFNFDWPEIRQEGIPDKNLWSWLITKRRLEASLSTAIKTYRLGGDAEDAGRELIWTLSKYVKGQSDLDPKPIKVREIVDFVGAHPTAELFVGGARFSQREIEQCHRLLKELQDSGVDLLTDPWPTPDRPSHHSGWVWDAYSEQRLLERANFIYAAALRIYETIVSRWFRTMASRLLFHARLPAQLSGWLTVMPEVGPCLQLETRSRPAGENSEVKIELGLPDGFADTWQSYWEEEITKLRQLRPAASEWIYPLSQSGLLDVFGSRPATRLAHDWLTDDLHRLNWLE